MNSNFVVLVDEFDQEIGIIDKLEAHKQGKLHRAFSVFIFNNNMELLLQRRAFEKYHSQGLWSNTCCSHPMQGESIISAGERRLKEELGMSCKLKQTFSFNYRAQVDNNLVEHEIDHVLIGFSNETPHLNHNEAIAFKWQNLNNLKKDIENNPRDYTQWLKIVIDKYFTKLKTQINL